MNTLNFFLNTLRNSWLQLTMILSFLCTAFLYGNIEKLTFEITFLQNPTILLTDKLFIILLIGMFWFISIFVIKQFDNTLLSQEQIRNQFTWFLTLLSTSLTRKIYVTTLTVYKALYHDQPRDNILTDNLFSIQRDWSFDELLGFAVKQVEKFNLTHHTQFKIALSEDTINQLCAKINTFSEMVSSVNLACTAELQRLNSEAITVENVIAKSNDYIIKFSHALNGFITNNCIELAALAILTLCTFALTYSTLDTDPFCRRVQLNHIWEIWVRHATYNMFDVPMSLPSPCPPRPIDYQMAWFMKNRIHHTYE